MGRRWLRDGRIIALALVMAYFAILLARARGDGRSLQSAWGAVGVPALAIPFADLSIIPLAAQAASQGGDPYGGDVGDADHRRFNYPRLWLLTHRLGLDTDRVELAGIVMGVAFFIAALAMAGPVRMGGGLLWAGVLCSPAVMLGVERGNVDLAVFCVLVLALRMLQRPLVAGGLVLLAAVTKLFPITSVVVFLRRPGRRGFIIAGATGLLFTVVLGLTADDVARIAENTPRRIPLAHGSAILSGIVLVNLGGSRSLWDAMAVGWVGSAVLGGAAWLRSRAGAESVAHQGRAAEAFLVGAPIMVTSFVLGPSFDYRWVFSLFCVPLWLDLARGRRDRLGRSARMALAALLFYLYWNLLGTDRTMLGIVPKQLLAWLLMYQCLHLAFLLLRKRMTCSAPGAGSEPDGGARLGPDATADPTGVG